jgi:hypothetical protein
MNDQTFDKKLMVSTIKIQREYFLDNIFSQVNENSGRLKYTMTEKDDLEIIVLPSSHG